MYNRCVITAANSAYFDTLLTLIASIHRHCYSLVDKVVVYDLGLTTEEQINLASVKNVEVRYFPRETPFTGYLDPKGHAYKPFCLYDAQRYAKQVLWLDAGVMLLQSAKPIFDIIEAEDVFLVGDSHLNRNFTHNRCREVMKATESELNDVQLSSGILGYKVHGRHQEFINEAYYYSLVEGCVRGDEQNHRHDQSVYSILASRHGLRKQDIDVYGYWTDSTRTLKTAIERGAVVFVHRRGHSDRGGLRYAD